VGDPNREFQTSSCGGPNIQEGCKWHDDTATPTCTSLDVVFEVTARTEFGEAVYVIGSVPALGEWSTNAAVVLAADEYTDANSLWKGVVSLGVGQDVQYKFIKIGVDGGYTWEADPNRMLTVPTECSATPMQSGAFQQ
jgi:glucoamylase